MGLIFEKIISYDHINGSLDKTNFTAANRNSIQFIDIHVRFEKILMPGSRSSSDFPAYFIQTKVNSVFTGRPQRSDSIHTNKAEGFQAKVGDTYVISGSDTSDGTGTILQILDNGHTLIVDQNYASLETFQLESAYFAITTPQTASEIKFNWIENQEPENYLSKTDGDEQRSTVGGLDYTDTVTSHIADMLGNKSWQSGSITVKGNGSGLGNSGLAAGVVQAFIITHEVIFGPLSLPDEWDDDRAGIQPTRFLNGNALKYIASISLSVQENNPNDITVNESTELLGNTGGFGENLNGKPNYYSFSTPVYTRLDSTVNPSLELTTNKTKINFSIFNTEKSPFSNGDTIIIGGFNFAPSDKAQFRDIPAATSQLMEHNFIFDQVIETLGSGGVAVPRQKQLGSNLIVFDNLKSIWVNNSQIDIEIELDMHLDVVSRIGANPVQQYMLYIEVANHLLDRASTDKVQLLIDANNFYTDVSDDGMIIQDLSILRHPFSDIETETEEFADLFIEADFVGVDNFYLDKNTREADAITITGITSDIIARKNSGASFVLDTSKAKSLSAFGSINYATFGAVQDINSSDPRGFKTPVDDVRANTKINRIYDTARELLGFFDLRSTFPSRVGFNDWTVLSPVNDEFYDPSEPNKGKNQDWIRYDARADWNLFYKSTITAVKNGDIQTYSAEKQITTFNYTDGDEWTAGAITSFDENNVSIPTFGIKYANGKLRYETTFIGSVAPAASDIVIDFHIYVLESGTLKSIYTSSSAYDNHPDTLFKSIDSSNRTVVTDQGGNLWRGEVLTDSAKMQAIPKSKFVVTAILYDKRGPSPPVPPAVGKLTEGGILKRPEGNLNFKIKE